MTSEKKIFERVYYTGAAVWTRTEPPEELAKLIDEGTVTACKALDVGCGEGFYSIYLTKRGFEVTGIDLSENAINIAKKNAAEREVDILFQSLDVSDISQLDDKFEFIFEWGVLHHLMPEKRIKYAQDIAEKLDKGGKYLSVCFNENCQSFGPHDGKFIGSQLGTKIYLSSQDELRELFSPHLKIIEQKIFTFIGGANQTHTANYLLMEKP